MVGKKRLGYFSILIAGVVIAAAIWYGISRLKPGTVEHFDGERAYQDVVYQVSLGPRVPNSDAHSQFVKWLQDQLTSNGWEVRIQETTAAGQPVQNVVASRGEGNPWIILGAHYDSRIYADQDPDPTKRLEAVPGANDGASGVGVLLELARTLPQNLQKQIWLVFFDAEDNGDIQGYDWIMGSRAFVGELPEKPDAVVVVDMIGDADLNIYMERNSDPNITREIWNQAAELGYSDQFKADYKFSMIDDHTPFLEAGIKAVDIIDFDYPYWHTTADTPDKVSAKSLQAVGDTLFAWLTKDQ